MLPTNIPIKRNLPVELRDIRAHAQNINFHPQALADPFRQVVMSHQTLWATVKEDRRTLKQIFEQYVFALAAIPAISGLLGYGLFSPLPFLHVLGMALTGYVASIGFLYGAAKLAQGTARMFDGEISPEISGKLVVFSLMPYFFSGIFLLLPKFAPLVLLGSFSFYLFFTGVSTMTRLPLAKRQMFCLINVVSWLVVGDFLRAVLFG